MIDKKYDKLHVHAGGRVVRTVYVPNESVETLLKASQTQTPHLH